MTADQRLSLIRVKIERAKKHIRDLEVKVEAFLELKPYIFLVEDDPETGKTRVYYSLRETETPAIILAITGDVLFNLRAALDHLAYHLARINTADEPILKQTYFPIFDDARKYRNGAPQKVKGMKQSVIQAIDAIEPYQGGKGHVLWQLNRLNNIDKHRTLITMGCELTGVNEEVDQNIQVTFTVALDEPPIIECQPLLPTLVGMADRVDDLITNFKPLLA